MNTKDHKHPLSYEDPSGYCDCDEAFALIEETVKQLRAELETVKQERDEARNLANWRQGLLPWEKEDEE